jgi:hypothetical protein
MYRSLIALAAALLLSGVGCSTLGGSAIRTGPIQLPAYSGPVAVYALGTPPPGVTDLGVVEVHGLQQDGTVEMLLPQFVRKVAQIGGNVAVIEGVRARFDLAGRSHVETFYYSCAFGATCAGQRVYSTNDEIVTITMFGRAMTTKASHAADPPLLPMETQRPEATESEAPSEEKAPEGER